MKFKDIMMFLALRGRKVTMASRIAAMSFLVLLSVGILIAGAISGSPLLVFMGAIWTVMMIIALAILIFINIRRNRPRL